MKKALCLIPVFSMWANLYAFELEAVKASDIKNQVEISVPAPEAENMKTADKAFKAYQYLWMGINSYSAGEAAQAYDYAARIDVTVRKIFDNQFNVSSRVDNSYDWGSVRKIFNDQYSLSGNGVYLNMNAFGSSYSVSGSVIGENNQYKYVNATLYRSFDDFSYNISGFGLNLNAGRQWINGSFDTNEYSKKAIAAVISLVLALQLDKAQTPAAAQK